MRISRNRLLTILAVFALLGAAVSGTFAMNGCSTPKRPDGGIGLLSKGAPAPDLEGHDAQGRAVRLSASAGKPRIVYFYPKDGTPGCTKEACAFRDAFTRFETEGVVIFGVSRDSEESHRAFRKEHNLPFPLVSDESGVAQRAYGVSTFLGMPSRVTFLVSPEGTIARVYPDVDPGVHADEVLADARALKVAAHP